MNSAIVCNWGPWNPYWPHQPFGDYICGTCGQTHGLGQNCPWATAPTIPLVPLVPFAPTFEPHPVTGWACPRCSRCYSPHVSKCEHCGPATLAGSSLPVP